MYECNWQIILLLTNNTCPFTSRICFISETLYDVKEFVIYDVMTSFIMHTSYMLDLKVFVALKRSRQTEKWRRFWLILNPVHISFKDGEFSKCRSSGFGSTCTQKSMSITSSLFFIFYRLTIFEECGINLKYMLSAFGNKFQSVHTDNFFDSR